MSLTGRTFTASLKPAWSAEQMVEFCNKLKGVATAFAINHDSDTDEDGAIKEVHTHVLLDYETPRKLTTVANLLGVEPNFVETVKSTKAMLKYLTHQDDPEKHQYASADVVTNSEISYDELILGQSLSDREIARLLLDGRGIELLGVVSASKLRTIQAFLQFDRSGAIQSQLVMVNRKLERLEAFVDNVERITTEMVNGVNKSVPQLVGALLKIGQEIEMVRVSAVQQSKMHASGSAGPSSSQQIAD